MSPARRRGGQLPDAVGTFTTTNQAGGVGLSEALRQGRRGEVTWHGKSTQHQAELCYESSLQPRSLTARLLASSASGGVAVAHSYSNAISLCFLLLKWVLQHLEFDLELSTLSASGFSFPAWYLETHIYK